MDGFEPQKIEFVPIHIRKDRKHYIVEDITRQEYYEMPEICVEAIDLLQSGHTLEEIEGVLIKKYPDEVVDIQAFLAQLWELKLLKRWGDKVQEIHYVDKPSLSKGTVSTRLQAMGRMMFHPVALCIYVILFLFNVVQVCAGTDRLPIYRDLFVTNSMMVNVFGWSLFGLVSAVLHECGHSLAVAAKGLRSRWRLGHRLFIPVLETEMSQVWTLPVKERYIPFLAGMCVDQVLLALCFGLQIVLPEEMGVNSWLRLFALHLMLSFLYQLLFFMKTDFYYIVENATGCYNLMENAKEELRRIFGLNRSTRGNEAIVYDGEDSAVRMYSVMYVIGMIISMLVLMFYIIPQLNRAWQLSWSHLQQTPWQPLFWDAVFFYVQLTTGALWVVLSWIRSWRERARTGH